MTLLRALHLPAQCEPGEVSHSKLSICIRCILCL